MEKDIFDLYFNAHAHASSVVSTYTDLVLDVHIPQTPPPSSIDYIASAPADSRTTFTGSGLPFVTLAQAFWKTPNMGTASVSNDGHAKVNLAFPNKICPFSMEDIPPTLFVRWATKKRDGFVYTKVKIADVSVPHRDVRFVQKFQNERLIVTQDVALRGTRFDCL